MNFSPLHDYFYKKKKTNKQKNKQNVCVCVYICVFISYQNQLNNHNTTIKKVFLICVLVNEKLLENKSRPPSCVFFFLLRPQ